VLDGETRRAQKRKPPRYNTVRRANSTCRCLYRSGYAQKCSALVNDGGLEPRQLAAGAARRRKPPDGALTGELDRCSEAALVGEEERAADDGEDAL
jgi:hypothetical protein